MPRTGRPVLPEGEKKEKTFRIRMTDTEREAIDAAAAESGKSASEWSREVLAKAASRGKRAERSG